LLEVLTVALRAEGLALFGRVDGLAFLVAVFLGRVALFRVDFARPFRDRVRF